MCEFTTPRYAAAGSDRRATCRPQQGSRVPARSDAVGRVAVILAVLAGFASNASAQVVDAPQLEVAGGYQLPQSFRPHRLEEWFVSVAGPLDERMALVGEVAGTSLREAGQGQTFLIGLRYAWPGRRVAPFVQGLVGGANLERTFNDWRYTGNTLKVESLFGAWQVGGGIDVRITRRIAARLAASSLTLHSERLMHFGEPSGRTTRFRFAAGTVLKVPPPSDAQVLDAPSTEVALGYQGFTNLRRRPFPRGWFVSVGRSLDERVTVVGEVADAYYRDVTPMIFVDEQHWYTYLAGVRYAWPVQRVVPFAQALGGAAVLSSREEALYEEPPRTRTYSYSYGALQLTGGVDILVTRHVAARFAASSLILFRDYVGANVLRFSTGVVVRFGGS